MGYLYLLNVSYSLSSVICNLRFCNSPHSMRSRVYETVERLSTGLSVCLIDQQQQRRAAGLLLSVVSAGDIDRWRREPRREPCPAAMAPQHGAQQQMRQCRVDRNRLFSTSSSSSSSSKSKVKYK